jgi:hypothetical protein
MSEVLRPYLVKLEEVRQACGSRDAALIRAILTDQAAYIADYEKQARFDVEHVTRNRLTDLINGTIYPTGFAYLYGYCLELVCRQFGQLDPLPLFEDFHSNFLAKVRELTTGPRRKTAKHDKKKPSAISISVADSKVSLSCKNIAVYQLQGCVTLLTGNTVLADPQHDWAVSGQFEGADSQAVLQQALASIGIEAVFTQTVYGEAMKLRNLGNDPSAGYRLKGLDFEAKRYPVPIPQYDDYPQISFLARDEFDVELKALRNKELCSTEVEINEARKEYAALIKKAEKLDRDLVFFI